MEYYKNEAGQIAILVSPGYGAGWSTWNTKELAYDKRVVEYWLSKKDDKQFMKEIDICANSPAINEARDYFKSIGYTGVYFGGFADIEINWIEPGIPFVIDEYDGSETLVEQDNISFTCLY